MPRAGCTTGRGSGCSSRGGYHSVDTGKLTTAPMFAVAAADRVEAFEAGG